jgi:HD-like signal output (HDOD) protein
LAENVKKRSLAQWVTLIRDQDMPIFGHTVQSIVSVAEDDEAPAAKLASVVLKDASLTTRVLKLVNSFYYNPQHQPISTISRAVIVLGFYSVRNMCLSISLVDAFVRGTARDHLTQALARAIHAAVQARSIAIERGDKSPEEIFIATLLFHIGDMAFWCFSGDTGEELDSLMKQPGYTPEQAQDEVLGFRLQSLSNNLAQEWHLSPLLQEVLTHPRDTGDRGRNITLAHEIAEAAEQHGWDSPETQQVMQAIGKLTGRSSKNTSDQIYRNAREASEIATYYGAANAARAIPLPDFDSGAKSLVPEPVIEYPQPDSMLQLKILRELAMLLENGCDLNMIMEMVMEGIYRGVGMDRVLFAMLTPDKKGLRAKFVLGHQNERLQNSFHFTRLPDADGRNIFFEAIDKECHLLVDAGKRNALSAMVNNAITSVIGKRPFLVSTVAINGRGIGILFADRALSGREIDEETAESFKHFAKQGNMGLTLLTTRR